jgi:hypothetical protein
MLLILITITIRDVLCHSASEETPERALGIYGDNISDADRKFGIGW